MDVLINYMVGVLSQLTNKQKNKTKRLIDQPQTGNIFKHTSDRGLVSQIYKEQLNNNKTKENFK